LIPPPALADGGKMVPNWSAKRVLVTGGAGLIESHLCKRVLTEDAEALCADNHLSGRRTNAAVLDDKRFKIVRHDMCFPLSVEADAIFNFACPASPIHNQFDPVQRTNVSMPGATSMLRLTKRLKCRVHQASTKRGLRRAQRASSLDWPAFLKKATALPAASMTWI
jgi:nucleoside-diphosphate-sugar epimerase